MNTYQAKRLSEYHSFTKKELHQILKDALGSLPETYWQKPSSNPLFDMGSYFNNCVKWVDYKEGENDEQKCSQPVVIRVLEKFSKFSKVQLPVKKCNKPDVIYREIPII